MSWSLQIANGDLTLGSAGLNTATGAEKLTQDLRCAILEPMGTDPLHPTFGSVIDGGTDPTGRTHASVIGNLNNNTASTLVGAEIQRICRAYQAQQIARNANDVAIYGKSTLTADEALISVVSVTTQAITTQMLVTATLQTGTGGLPLAIPFS